MYRTILVEKQESTSKAKVRLERGLDVLASAAVEIAKLKTSINEMAPILEATSAELQKTLEIVDREQKEAAIEKAQVDVEAKEAEKQEEEASALMNDANQKLAEALPMLEEATRVLKEIKRDDLVFLNAIQKPT